MNLSFHQSSIETFIIVTTPIWAQTGKWRENSCSWARHKCKWACWCHVQTQICMHSKHSLPLSTIAAAFNQASLCNYGMGSGRTWMDMKYVVWLAWPWVFRHIKAMSKHILPFSVMEEFGHSLQTTGMNRQTGRGDTSLSHRIRASDHFITRFFSQGWSCWGVTPCAWLQHGFNSKQWRNRPLTPAICPPANISWVWGNTLCWTEVGRALESSDLD